MVEMGSSSETSNKSIDASVGGLVWVRRRNGSWWPGRIMGLDELPDSSAVSPRSGTPVKLLGRDDASVDWYNLERSKRVKAFRCGEYDECIEKAKAHAASSNKKAVKYARREDAIIHALEIENARLGKDNLDFSARMSNSGGEHGCSARESPAMSHSGEENEVMVDDVSDSENSSDSAPELSQSGISFEEPNHISSSKLQTVQGRRRRTPNDSEDDGTEGVKRMRGLEDLGMGVVSKKSGQTGGLLELVQQDSASLLDSNTRNGVPNGSPVNGSKGISSLKRKRSQVANANEVLKRKNRSRPLTKVLESTAMVSIPVTCDQFQNSCGSPLQGLSDGRVSGLESNESKGSLSVDHNGISCENGASTNAPERAFGASCINGKIKENEIPSISGLAENDSSDRLFDVPFAGEEKDPSGYSPIIAVCSSGKPQIGALGRQSSQSSQAEAVSLRDERINESGSTSSAALHDIGQSIEKETNLHVQSTEFFHSNRDGSPSDTASCISTVGDTTASVKKGDADADADYESVTSYPTTAYYGYTYPGYDMENQGYYVGGSGMEMQYPVMQADNGSFVYLMPGFQPGYDPYTPYMPITTVGSDGQYVSQQMYPPLSPMYQAPISPGYNPSLLPYGELVPSPYLWDPSLVGDGTFGNAYNGVLETPPSKPSFSSPSHNRAPLFKSPKPLDVQSGFGARNQPKPVNKASVRAPSIQSEALAKGYFSVAKVPVYNQGTGGLLYPNNSPTLKANAKGWGGSEKLKPRSKANGVRDISLFNEKNHGPRTTNPKGALLSGAEKENGKCDSIASAIRKDQYNLPDFPTKYEQALFFVIKSYSEDDIHKSIKYNVWASTPNGNKRLDSAYQDAEEKVAQKSCKCPVFLFFSVNASGQFCGVAEMIGRVDFNKSMDFWQQDKWNGYFPVKWHIIKDVPNPQLRHIILENNENKPVTNSRDTQEVKFLQGIEMLNIFKNHLSKTSILDDFDFYESRQKVMQEKRIRQSTPYYDLQQKIGELSISAE